MFNWLDRLANWWLQMRSDWRIANDEEYRERFSGLKEAFEKTKISHDVEGHLQAIIEHPIFAYMGEEAAQLLDQVNAKNYFSFVVTPHPPAPLRPVEVTLRWAHKKSLAAVNEMLMFQVAEMKHTLNAIAYAKTLDIKGHAYEISRGAREYARLTLEKLWNEAKND